MKPRKPWWGELLIVVGIISGVWGILLLALAQQDLSWAKTLAYSLRSRTRDYRRAGHRLGAVRPFSYDNPALATLGFAGSNAVSCRQSRHVQGRAVLLGAGRHSTVDRHAAGLDRLLGGLLKRHAGGGSDCFLVATAAITAIPPLNGFMGEFLIYLGAFREGELLGAAPASAALAVIASLALIGGLAVVTFTKVFGIAFLGAPRTREAAMAEDSRAHWWLTAPMVVLAVGCVAAGLGAPLLLCRASISMLSLFDSPARRKRSVVGGTRKTAESLTSIVMRGCRKLGGFDRCARRRSCGLLLLASWPREVTQSGTWGCGYIRRPTPRMQYTGFFACACSPAVDFFYLLLRTRRSGFVATRMACFPAKQLSGDRNRRCAALLLLSPHLFNGGMAVLEAALDAAWSRALVRAVRRRDTGDTFDLVHQSRPLDLSRRDARSRNSGRS